MTYKNKLRSIFNKHGFIKQLNKLSEEISELQIAITQYEYPLIKKKNKELIKFEKEHVTEEFADVMILLMQIQLHYDLDENGVIEFMKQKINRQCKRDTIDEKE